MSKEATPSDGSNATLRHRRRAPWFVRVMMAWSQLLLAIGLLRVMAVVSGLLPSAWLARSAVGPGTLAAVGAGLAAAGLFIAVVVWRRSGGWRRFGLLVLLLSHAMMAILFPPRWLLDRFQSDEALFYVVAERPVFALTIDDGLDAEATPMILEVLKKHDAKATFFVLGETLDAYPELAERCVAAGHELANHQMSDTPAVVLPDDVLETRLRDADERLNRFTTPVWFRPGGGIGTERSQAVAEQLGYRTALGSVFSFDSHLTSVRFHTAYVAGRTEAGDIVVMHDRGERGQRTATVLNEVLPKLKKRGLTAVTLSDLVEGE